MSAANVRTRPAVRVGLRRSRTREYYLGCRQPGVTNLEARYVWHHMSQKEKSLWKRRSDDFVSRWNAYEFAKANAAEIMLSQPPPACAPSLPPSPEDWKSESWATSSDAAYTLSPDIGDIDRTPSPELCGVGLTPADTAASSARNLRHCKRLRKEHRTKAYRWLSQQESSAQQAMRVLVAQELLSDTDSESCSEGQRDDSQESGTYQL